MNPPSAVFAARSTVAVLALAALAGHAVTLPLYAQAPSTSRVVHGAVRSVTGEPLADAELVLLGSEVRTTTNADGAFVLRLADTVTRVLVVRKIGYTPEYLELQPLTLSGQQLMVVLKPGPLELPEIEVTARAYKPASYAWTSKYDDFFRRERVGLGKFLSREDIKQAFVPRTVELLKLVPGFRVLFRHPGYQGIEVEIARCRENRVGVWIDGQRLAEPIGAERAGASGDGAVIGGKASGNGRPATFLAEQLSMIDPNDIEMMEVYRGTSQIPGEFLYNSCAAIVIWTR